MTRTTTTAVVIGLVVALAGVARADTVIRKLEYKAAPAKDPKAPKDAPPPADKILAKVKSDIPNLKAPDFKMVYSEGETPAEEVAGFAQMFKDSADEMALLILVQGSERFMGNPSTMDDEGNPREPTEGAYEHLKPAIDALLKVGPNRTRASLLVYGKDVAIRVPMGDRGVASGESMGAVKDYFGVGEKQFKNGLEKAFELLNADAAARKILVVIGDGGDTNATVNIADTAKKLQDAEIEVYVIRATPKREDFENAGNKTRMNQLAAPGKPKDATKVGDIPELAQQIAVDIDSLYSLEFGTTSFPHDGAEHEYTVLAKRAESRAMGITLPKVAEVVVTDDGDGGGTPWWVWLLVSVGALGLIVAGVMIFGRKAEPMPFQEMAPPPQMSPPPASGGPMKTMMLGIGGKEDGMPVVGWIVPLSGPAQYQTYKLQTGKTLIGTSSDCNVVVQDAFMSTHHCEIVMTPSGFSLIDKGSTNGCLVNQRRVPTHELVDNDVITLGKTDFKFKSTL